jgi:hypothetical protein
VTLGGLVIVVVAIVLVILSYVFKDPVIGQIIGILIMSLILFMAVLLFFLAIGVLTVSVGMIVRLERPNDATEFSFYLIKRKLGRCVVFFLLLLFPLLFLAITNAITYVWHDFWTFWPYAIWQVPMNCVISVFFGILTCYTLIHVENAKLLYKCNNK